MGQCPLSRRGSGSLAGLKTFPAKDGTPLRGAEGDRGFTAALGADGRRFNPSRKRTPFRRRILPFHFARFAAFRLVPEILLVIELLFARGEDKVRTAVHTF